MDFKEFIKMLMEINGQAWVDANLHELEDMRDCFIVIPNPNLLSDPNEQNPSKLISDETFWALTLGHRLFETCNLN